MKHTSILAIMALSLCVACSNSPEDEPLIIAIDTDQEVGTDEVVVDEGPDEPDVAPAMGPLPKFVGTELLTDLNPRPNIVEVKLQARPKAVQLADDLELEMYTFNGSIPGPLLEATVGDTVIVHFTNHLPEPTTIHWHGLRIGDDMDGNPRIQDPVKPGESFTYRFVVPDAGTFWYHPHVRTYDQIERGLYGTLVVHERPEDRPRHDRERYFVLDDILLDDDGLAPAFAGHMELMHGRMGNALLTNGTMEMVTGTATAGERERWRLVNTANARTMEVTIAGARFVVYGTDGGRVEPFEADTLLIPVGQRYDVEVIYDEPGEVKLQQLVLVRNASGQVVTQAYDVATIDVTTAPAGTEPTTVVWGPAPTLPDRPIDREETIVLDAVQGGELGVLWRINGQAHAMEPLYEFQQGETVKMTIRNMLGPEHPFHLHGQFFTIEGKPGLWDTVLVGGQQTVEITAFMDNPGEWMLHCHIAEHSEVGMMSHFIVH